MYYEMKGTILPQIRLVDMAVLEPPYIHRKRQADEYIIYIMTKGTLYLQENGSNYELKAGDVLMLDPDFVHQGLRASSCEYYYIHFRHPEIIRRQEDMVDRRRCLNIRSEALQEDSGSYELYRPSWLQFPKCMSLRHGSSYLQVIKLIQEAMDHNRNKLENYKLLSSLRIMEALVEIAREALSSEILRNTPVISRSYHNIHALLNYLNANYQKEISSKLIEELFSCNFDYLNRVFKRSIGKTIFVYLNEIRIKHAKEFIAATPMKLTAIGYRVGFQDEGYFNKVFKKYTGMTPGQYEKLTSRVEMDKDLAIS